jgi:hypothetical protein
MKDNALSASNPDEYLYGRAGYLYTLMFLRREIRNDIIDKQLIIDVKKNNNISFQSIDFIFIGIRSNY